MNIIKTNYFIYPTAFISGYALHFLNGKIIELARQNLGIHADFFKGLKEEDYRRKHLEELAQKAPAHLSCDTYLRQMFFSQGLKTIFFAIIEEVGFRYYLQKHLLPPLLNRVCPKFTKSAALIISIFSFSFFHFLNENTSKAQKNATFINTTLLGLVASTTSQWKGLSTSIALHMGFNTRSWKLSYYALTPGKD